MERGRRYFYSVQHDKDDERTNLLCAKRRFPITDSKQISEIVKRIKDAASEIARGNYNVKIPISAEGEVADLVRSFNSLIESLKDQMGELSKLSDLRLKTELKYRNLYDNAPDLYRSVNADGIIIDCNRSYAQHLGYTKEEILGKSVFDHMADRSIDDFHKVIELWKKEGLVSNKEIWLKRKDGSIFPVLLNSSSLHDIDGKLLGSNTILRDMSEIYQVRKKIEEDEAQIKEQMEELSKLSDLRLKTELKYRNLYDNAPDLYRSVNADGIIIDCNRSYAQHLGYTKEEILGKSVFDHTSNKSIEDFHTMVEIWKKEGLVRNFELWLKRKDGTEFPALLSSTGLHDSDGKLIGSNTVLKDITEIYEARKKIEASEALIRKQFEDLKEIDEQKSKFSSMITHELKTPFVPIKGYCEMLREPGLLGDLNTEQQEVVEGIYKNCIRLEKLIGDVLDAQLLDMKHMKFYKESFAVDEFLKNIMTDFVPAMKEKQIEFVNSTTESVIISTDKNRLYQILRNLLSNAIDFTPIKGRIEINVHTKDNKIIFYVKDNGIGIPFDKQKNLFQKFYQVESIAKRKHGGNGLGLSICKGIVEGLGGRIWCESSEGKGAIFYFAIPR